MPKKIVKVRSLDDLAVIAKTISKLLKPDRFLLISGELGAGKTTIVKMIAKNLGISENVSSPTFNVLKSYWIAEQNCFLNHFDFFNLKKNEELLCFEDLKIGNINVLEWPEMNECFWKDERELIIIKIFLASQNQRLVEYYWPE